MAKGPDPATGADRLAHRRAHPWSGSSPSASMTAALSGLERVGVDEVSYRRRHRYLTVVADHDTGRIVSLADGRNSQTLGDLFAELGDPKHSLRAISIDLSGADAKANREQLPGARIPHDPSTSSGSPPTPSTRSATTKGTPTTAPTPLPAAGPSTPAGRC
ncbi:MAG TPA: transposase [Solirubrobacteraceae bacterium]|nr:transposase [Solirubrobacteraceae bacterium]